jgi:hypothetical protein
MTPAAKTSAARIRQMPAAKTESNGKPVVAAPATAVITRVYCTLCTRTVEAVATFVPNGFGRKRMAVQARQRCPHCGASLDAAFVLANLPQAA